MTKKLKKDVYKEIKISEKRQKHEQQIFIFFKKSANNNNVCKKN